MNVFTTLLLCTLVLAVHGTPANPNQSIPMKDLPISLAPPKVHAKTSGGDIFPLVKNVMSAIFLGGQGMPSTSAVGAEELAWATSNRHLLPHFLLSHGSFSDPSHPLLFPDTSFVSDFIHIFDLPNTHPASSLHDGNKQMLLNIMARPFTLGGPGIYITPRNYKSVCSDTRHLSAILARIRITITFSLPLLHLISLAPIGSTDSLSSDYLVQLHCLEQAVRTSTEWSSTKWKGDTKPGGLVRLLQGLIDIIYRIYFPKGASPLQLRTNMHTTLNRYITNSSPDVHFRYVKAFVPPLPGMMGTSILDTIFRAARLLQSHVRQLEEEISSVIRPPFEVKGNSFAKVIPAIGTLWSHIDSNAATLLGLCPRIKLAQEEEDVDREIFIRVEGIQLVQDLRALSPLLVLRTLEMASDSWLDLPRTMKRELETGVLIDIRKTIDELSDGSLNDDQMCDRIKVVSDSIRFLLKDHKKRKALNGLALPHQPLRLHYTQEVASKRSLRKWNILLLSRFLSSLLLPHLPHSPFSLTDGKEVSALLILLLTHTYGPEIGNLKVRVNALLMHVKRAHAMAQRHGIHFSQSAGTLIMTDLLAWTRSAMDQIAHDIAFADKEPTELDMPWIIGRAIQLIDSITQEIGFTIGIPHVKI